MMWGTFAGVVRLLIVWGLAVPALAEWGGKPQQFIRPYQAKPLQDIVTWDKHSLFVRGQRIMFYSGEFHPFRLPVPGLWLDVFQKIRSAGYTGVSFYVDWALLEGQPGKFEANGVFALEPFFDAAKKAGVYLLARPGPYINAEVSGGGFPGWLQRLRGHPRTADEDYLSATEIYVKAVGAIIAEAQITNGGPVILFQPENEYTWAGQGFKQPDPLYMQKVMNQFRAAGITVPFISNDAANRGHNAPGTPAPVDIYGHDAYPLGFDCANPTVWPAGKLPTDWRAKHLQQSPNTPYSIVEFQGGAFDPWGGPGFEKCVNLVNHEFERVFFKNDFSFGLTIFNVYMTYGGTNWGNLGHAGGYTSYDYGAMIAEDRSITREKYSEAKLEANFIIASPAYLTAESQVNATSRFVDNKAITATLLKGNKTQFLVVRHTDYSSTKSDSYSVTLPDTSVGELVIPQGGGALTLNGRDSKILVFDYELNAINILYSTAEVLTWQEYEGKTILVVHTGPNEQHEMAVALSNGNELPKALLGSGIAAAGRAGYTILRWTTSTQDRALQLGPLTVYFLDRNSAYKHWVIDVPKDSSVLTPYTKTGALSLIIKGGYLIRSATVSGTTVGIIGDVTPATRALKIIGGAPKGLKTLTFNGQPLKFTQDANNVVTANIDYREPKLTLPDLKGLQWYYTDSLPEIQPDYSDAAWTKANYPKTDNTLRNITTPTSLYGSEYGFHTGALVYRGTFKAFGNETTLYLQTAGGSAYAMSAFLDTKLLGSFTGYDAASLGNNTFEIPKLAANSQHVITVVVDNMGLQENWVVGEDEMKTPRGILDYKLDGHASSDISWTLTGNYGGEATADKIRGPLNEGGLWAERQGYHLPAPPVRNWKISKPTDGINKAGIAWYVTSFDLDMPKGYDIPLSFKFTNSSTPFEAAPAHAYRVNLYVNGWQFGKYVNNIGPQTNFPVPEGILNYHGTNWISLSLWALEPWGAAVTDLKLVAGQAVQTGYGPVPFVQNTPWSQRPSVY